VEKNDFAYLSSSLEEFLKEAGFTGSVESVDETNEPTGVLTTLGITGDKVGFLTLTMGNKNAVLISRRFARLMEIPIESDELSDAHLEALAELTNQIAGRVVMFMEDNQLNCSITPPSVMSGGDISFSLKTMKIHRTFKITLSKGHFFVTIGIK
jgi:CheY-specific phosphatase CheX